MDRTSRATGAKFDFTLETEGRDVLDDEVVDALYEAGCDDALIGRFLGIDRLGFTREASSYCEAVRSAIEDVQSVPGVRVTRVLNEEAQVGADFTEAVNMVLSCPEQHPHATDARERVELRRIQQMTAGVPSGITSG